MMAKPISFGLALVVVLFGATMAWAALEALAPVSPRPMRPSDGIAVPVSGKETDAAMADAVRRYFQEMKTASEGTLLWEDSQVFANQLVQEVLAGQTTTLDRMQTDTGSVLQRTRKIQPPAPCREHHSTSVTLLEKTGEIFSRMARAAGSKDIDALMAVTGQMSATDSDTKALQSLEAALKRRFGVETNP